MTLQQMIDNFPGLSADDLLALNKAAAHAWTTRSDEIRRSFKVGNRVTFLDRHGVRLFGSIVKIMRKNVSVDVNGMKWRVSPGVLQQA
jgi:hypothetical protein